MFSAYVFILLMYVALTYSVALWEHWTIHNVPRDFADVHPLPIWLLANLPAAFCWIIGETEEYQQKPNTKRTCSLFPGHVLGWNCFQNHSSYLHIPSWDLEHIRGNVPIAANHMFCFVWEKIKHLRYVILCKLMYILFLQQKIWRNLSQKDTERRCKNGMSTSFPVYAAWHLPGWTWCSFWSV